MILQVFKFKFTSSSQVSNSKRGRYGRSESRANEETEPTLEEAKENGKPDATLLVIPDLR